MKKIIIVAIFAFCLSIIKASGQHIDLPTDSVTSLLCKKWEMNYVIMNGMKIQRGPGAPQMFFQFNKDNSLLMTTNDPGKKTKGTWSYDPNEKLVKLIINGKTNTTVIDLNDKELVMLMDTREATPDDPTPIKTHFRIKS